MNCSKPLDGLNISDLLLGHQDKLDRKAVLYFTPVSSGGLDLHCARKGAGKMRFAQLNGEIYILDYTVGHDSFLLPRAELYNLDADPSECFNVAKEHPDIVKAISTEVVEEIKTMPPDVIEAFARLRHNVAHPTTPPTAAPRPQTCLTLTGRGSRKTAVRCRPLCIPNLRIRHSYARLGPTKSVLHTG